MKILVGYPHFRYHDYDSKERIELWVNRLKKKGFKVDLFCLTLDPPNRNLIWNELDSRWKKGNKKLIIMYKNLLKEIEGYDALVNLYGINLHPEFVKNLPIFTVFGCGDDPEASEILSKPVAWAYDLCMVQNIAEVDTYHKWGINNAYYWPLGYKEEDYNPLLSEKNIKEDKRDIDITLICDFSFKRRDRLIKFSSSFPQGAYYGNGWPNGFLPSEKKVPIYQRSKIGINFHLSTGPINFRTFELPANGVMQICDNRDFLGKIFKLNKEAIGFDSIEEAIELCNYYLENDTERIKIAIRGWKRATKDYNETKVFEILVNRINEQKENTQNIKEKVNILQNKKISNLSNYYEFIEK